MIPGNISRSTKVINQSKTLDETQIELASILSSDLSHSVNEEKIYLAVSLYQLE